jgi:hypothetical protein
VAAINAKCLTTLGAKAFFNEDTGLACGAFAGWGFLLSRFVIALVIIIIIIMAEMGVFGHNGRFIFLQHLPTMRTNHRLSAHFLVTMRTINAELGAAFITNGSVRK